MAAVGLFLIPGMDHCSGGAGCDTFDKVGFVEQSVENGRELRVHGRDACGQTRGDVLRPTRPCWRMGPNRSEHHRPDAGGELPVMTMQARYNRREKSPEVSVWWN
jgi:hypothetical protein